MFTNTDLLNFVATRALSPSSTATLTDADILRFADAEVYAVIAPFLHSAKAGYGEVTEDVALVANQASYAIPSRAFGNRIVALFAVSPDGLTISDIPIVSPADEYAYKNYGGGIYGTVAFIRGSNIVLNPVPGTGLNYTLRIAFNLRPNRLVPVSSTSTITALTSTTITVASMPAGLVTGTLFDVVNGQAPNQIRTYNKSGTVAGNVITMTAVPDGLAVGDYVALAQQTPVVNLPTELHPIIWQRTAARVLETFGDVKAASLLYKAADEYLSQFMNVVTPRVDATPKVINVHWDGGSANWYRY